MTRLLLLALLLLPACDISIPLDGCATSLQCDHSEMCSRSHCRLRCHRQADCATGEGCYETDTPASAGAGGWLASCEPEDSALLPAQE